MKVVIYRKMTEKPIVISDNSNEEFDKQYIIENLQKENSIVCIETDKDMAFVRSNDISGMLISGETINEQ